MMTNLFNQFTPPSLMGLPLYIFTILMPLALFPSPKPNWINSRTLTLMLTLKKMFLKEFATPLKTYTMTWTIFLGSLLTFLVSTNLIGLLPYTFTPTTQLSLNLSLAVPLWLATVIIGLCKQTSSSLAHILPQGSPTWLIPLLVMIETISLLIRPMALGVRLTANLTAGHLLIQLLATATMATNTPLSALIFMTLTLLTLLEIAVALIQAYVFVLLLSLYLKENTDSISHIYRILFPSRGTTRHWSYRV